MRDFLSHSYATVLLIVGVNVSIHVQIEPGVQWGWAMVAGAAFSEFVFWIDRRNSN